MYLVLGCGGTIVSQPDRRSGALVPRPSGPPLARALRDLDCEPHEIFVEPLWDLDSTEMDQGHWEVLVDRVWSARTCHRGVIVVMGTNTMAYAASALAFALRGVRLPIVFTGAQIPLGLPGSDAPSNLQAALSVCRASLPGVYVAFGKRVIRGARAKKVSESHLDAFRSFNDKDVARIHDRRLLLLDSTPTTAAEPTTPRNRFSRRVASITLVPGRSADVVSGALLLGAEGIVLRGFGPGDVPESLGPVLDHAAELKVPVVLTTQCPRGRTRLGTNLGGYLARRHGVIDARDMSMEAMTTKMMWLIGQRTRHEMFRRAMMRDLCGEIDLRR